MNGSGSVKRYWLRSHDDVAVLLSLVVVVAIVVLTAATIWLWSTVSDSAGPVVFERGEKSP
jgi:hypothetical protein